MTRKSSKKPDKLYTLDIMVDGLYWATLKTTETKEDEIMKHAIKRYHTLGKLENIRFEVKSIMHIV